MRAAVTLALSQENRSYRLRHACELSRTLGCDRGDLWRLCRDSGVLLGEMMCRLRVLRALCTFSGSWAEVEVRLEVSSSSLSHLFRRVSGCTRQEALQRKLGSQALYAMEVVPQLREILSTPGPDTHANNLTSTLGP